MSPRMSFNRLAATALTALALSAGLSGCNMYNGSGNYVGVVSRIQTDGILESCKTWEGEIGAISMRRQGSGSTMHFTAKEAGIAAQLEDAMNKQYPVRIEFTDTANPWPCSQGSRDVVTKVERLDAALNGPLAGHMTSGDSDGPATVMPRIVAGSGQKILICTEAEPAPATEQAAAPANPPPAPAAARVQQPLPDVLRLHR